MGGTNIMESLSPAAHDCDAPLLHASVYEELRARMITGKFVPGIGISTRALALELGVSQMPVRDALSRLAAEGAVQIRSKRRIEIPQMTGSRFTDLLDCRLLLEPEAAVQAMPHITAERVRDLAAYDQALETAIENGDVLGYMENNYAFHFGMYRSGSRPTLVRLIETLWLQFGPYMRLVHERVGAATIVDQHHLALAAIAKQDGEALRAAVAADIRDGMDMIGKSRWPRI